MGAPPDWTPILSTTTDDFPRSVAALRRDDVLLVNPIRDGLNLVAKEGALVNDRDGAARAVTEAGAWDELAGAAIRRASRSTSAAPQPRSHSALEMDDDARAEREPSAPGGGHAPDAGDWSTTSRRGRD